MIIIVFFTDLGIPKTGLTPTVDVWEDDGSQVVTAQSMTEVAGGFYKYDFATYDETKNYCIRADGGAGLSANDRYVFTANEIGQVTEDLTDIKGTGFVKNTDSLRQIRPEVDKIKYVLGLVQENFRLKNQVYDSDGNLLSAIIRIYSTAADCESDTNQIAEYTVTASYTGGNCTEYKVKKV